MSVICSFAGYKKIVCIQKGSEKDRKKTKKLAKKTRKAQWVVDGNNIAEALNRYTMCTSFEWGTEINGATV